MKKFLVVALLALSSVVVAKPQLVVLTDIGNEPDDQMSLVRLMMYSNDIDLRALVATTSTWQRDKRQVHMVYDIIDAYEKVLPNLQKHASGWPAAQTIRDRVFIGPEGYGMAGIKPDDISGGAKALIDVVDSSEQRVWVSVWGGANTLAEALQYLRNTRDDEAVDRFQKNIIVYSISDQDDAGVWIRKEFPLVEYINFPTNQTGEEYGLATWTGIAGDRYYRNGDGADFSWVSHEWLQANIRDQGVMGAAYPEHWFIMEGDTPSFLNLIANGLHSHISPNWGGWGGRYIYRTPQYESRPYWTQGGDMFSRVTSADTIQLKGREVSSDHATIWRWRPQFQSDFAARMRWSLDDATVANHPPRVIVNGKSNDEPIYITMQVGEQLTLDASKSNDPDKDKISYRWFHYAEAGYNSGQSMAGLELINADTDKVTVKATTSCRPQWLPQFSRCEPEGIAHVILEVSDGGEPTFTRYQRIVIKVEDKNVAAQEAAAQH